MAEREICEEMESHNESTQRIIHLLSLKVIFWPNVPTHICSNVEGFQQRSFQKLQANSTQAMLAPKAGCDCFKCLLRRRHSKWRLQRHRCEAPAKPRYPLLIQLEAETLLQLIWSSVTCWDMKPTLQSSFNLHTQTCINAPHRRKTPARSWRGNRRKHSTCAKSVCVPYTHTLL